MSVNLTITINPVRNTICLPDGKLYNLGVVAGETILAELTRIAAQETRIRTQAKKAHLTSSQTQQLVNDWLEEGNVPQVATDSMTTEQMEEALAAAMAELL